MAHFKLNDVDEKFLHTPQDATLVFAGASGTETFIERERDTVVRISIKSVAVATADGGSLEVVLELDGQTASGQDGPSPIESQLRASQGVQVLVKAGQRLAFKAYPKTSSAHVLRTIVWTADMKPVGVRDTETERNGHQQVAHPAPSQEQPVN